MGLLRTSVGIALMAAPGAPMRLAGTEPPTGAALLLMRTVGIRDLVLGFGTVSATRPNDQSDARRWISATLASDALDTIVSLAALRSKPLRMPERPSPSGGKDPHKDQHTAFSTRRVQQCCRGRQQQVALGVGIGRGGLGQLTKALGERRDQSSEGAAVALHVPPQQLLIGMGHVVAQRLGERCVRRTRPLAAPPQHDHAIRMRSPRHLGHKRRLALTWLARDEHHFAARTGGRPLDDLTEELELGASAHHAGSGTMGQPGGEGNLSYPMADREGLPGQTEDIERLGKPFEFERADGEEGVGTPPSGRRARQ
jgi:hypothetical protein